MSNLETLWTPFAPHFFIITDLTEIFKQYVKSKKKYFLFMKIFPFRA